MFEGQSTDHSHRSDMSARLLLGTIRSAESVDSVKVSYSPMSSIFTGSFRHDPPHPPGIPTETPTITKGSGAAGPKKAHSGSDRGRGQLPSVRGVADRPIGRCLFKMQHRSEALGLLLPRHRVNHSIAIQLLVRRRRLLEVSRAAVALLFE